MFEKEISKVIVRISTLLVYPNLKNFSLASLFHPARLLDSGNFGSIIFNFPNLILVGISNETTMHHKFEFVLSDIDVLALT